MADERAVSPVVGKVLEVGLVALYVSLLTTTLYGGIVPEYRTAAGTDVGDRVLATSNQRVQQAVPPNATSVAVRNEVDLPRTIRDQPYTIRVENRSLVLDHPHDAIGRSTRMALPPTVSSVDGEWSSRKPAVVTVTKESGGLAVRLRTEDP